MVGPPRGLIATIVNTTLPSVCLFSPPGEPLIIPIFSRGSVSALLLRVPANITSIHLQESARPDVWAISVLHNDQQAKAFAP
jgi:hypothetical protein